MSFSWHSVPPFMGPVTVTLPPTELRTLGVTLTTAELADAMVGERHRAPIATLTQIAQDRVALPRSWGGRLRYMTLLCCSPFSTSK